jgi:hypothetical protein
VQRRKTYSSDLKIQIVLYNFIDEILSALNNKMHVGGISCDLAKAFDSVNHELLLPKLHFYVILKKAGQLFESYLHDRRQQAEIKPPDSSNSIYLNCGIIKHGVP